MSDRHETIADIIAEMRQGMNPNGTAECQYLESDICMLADRLEAALKRELSKNTSKNGADFGQLGDAAKLREALEFCVKGMCGFCRMDAEARGMTTECVNGCEALRKAKAALAAPPRNCDRPECATTKAAQEVWRREDGGKTAYYEWLLATTTEKEGGAK